MESVARVEELADNDPFKARGVIKERSVRPWTLSIGEDNSPLRHACALPADIVVPNYS